MLSTHHLTITVPGRTLLDAVSMSVRPGELLCIIGPNGAGKTTLLRSLAGEIDAARDQVRLAGRLLRDMSPTACGPSTPSISAAIWTSLRSTSCCWDVSRSTAVVPGATTGRSRLPR